MLQIRFFLFGPPRIEQKDQPIPLGIRKGIALLVYLAVTRQAHSRDALATLFWPESSQQEARASLRRMLYRLNQLFRNDVVLAERDLVQLEPTVDLWLDVMEFRQIVAASLQRDSGAILDELRRPLEEAVDLYTDDFMAGFSLPDCAEFDDWQFFQREELRQLLASTLEKLMGFYEEQAQFEQAISFARRWLAMDRMHEPAHRHLMRLYACAGQQSAALRQYEECVRILDEELGVEPEDETSDLFEAIRLRRFPAEPTRTTAPVQLPAVHTAPERAQYPLPVEALPLVGRDVEVAQLHNMLANPRCRLITLVGLGGNGKTHLALEAAHRLADKEHNNFPDGIVFVPLADRVDRSDLVGNIVFALADALGLSLSGQGEAARQVFDFLCTQKMLIVLDNFEHLLYAPGAEVYAEPVLALVEEILESAGGVKLLVTSREPLQLRAEWRLDLGGLVYPEEEELISESSLDAYSAVRLFAQFAQQVQPSFEMTPQNAPAIFRLCRLVSGSPLALKLAAAWVRIFTCERIVNDIEKNLNLLSTQMRNVPERQRSMRAIFDYTWQLLSVDEQQLFLAISVFRNGFTEVAATEVAAATPHLLAALLDRGLLQVRSTAQGIRYTLHDLTRQYAMDRLAAEPSYAQQVQDRHTIYYVNLLDRLKDAVIGGEQPEALAILHADIDNIELMWERVLNAGDLGSMHRGLDSLWRYHWSRTPGQKGKQFCTEAINVLEQSASMQTHPLYAAVLRTLYGMRGEFHYFLGDYDLARSDTQLAMVLARQLGLRKEEMDMAVVLSSIARWQGETDDAEANLRQALAFYQQTGYRGGEADVQHELAQLYVYTGQYAEAKACAAESLSISLELGRPDWIGWALDALGWVSFCCGDYAAASQHYNESLSYFERIGHQLGISLAWGGLGMVAWAGGSQPRAEAQAFMERSLDLCRHMNHQFHISSRLSVLAQINNDAEHYAQAESQAREGLEIARKVGSSLFTALNLCCLAESLYYRGNLTNSRVYVREALKLAYDIRQMPALTLALLCYATLAVIESELAEGETAQQIAKQIQAIALLERVIDHPACWSIHQEKARQLLSDLTRKWPAEIVKAAALSNQVDAFDDQVLEILGETICNPSP